MLLPIALAGCLGSEDGRSTSFMEDSSATQRYPDNYRAELLAFMRTYLNNPVGVRNAEMAEPVQRTVGGRVRYVACLRFVPRESDGTYREIGTVGANGTGAQITGLSASTTSFSRTGTCPLMPRPR